MLTRLFKKKCFFALALVTVLFTLSLASKTVHAEALYLYDDFNDNAINPSLWTAYQTGSGPTIGETNQRVEVNFPTSSAGAFFGGEYRSEQLLTGDFDIQVDYDLLLWPLANGVRIGLAVDQGMVERTSLGTGYVGTAGEVYLMDFHPSLQGITVTSDMTGKLRLARSGSTLSGYYFGSNDWILIGSASVTTADTYFSIAAWSHDYFFTDQEVELAFDNLFYTTPEPATLLVLALGLIPSLLRKNRKK